MSGRLRVEPRHRGSGTHYSLRIEERSGDHVVLPVVLDDRAVWAAPLDVDPTTITAAALVDESGYVWRQATFET